MTRCLLWLAVLAMLYALHEVLRSKVAATPPGRFTRL